MAWIRYLLYFFGITLVVGVLVRLEVNYPGFLNLQVFPNPTDSLGTSEYSPIELMQPLMLASCGLLMAWVALYCPGQRTLAVAFGGIALACLLRELDFFFDRFLIDNLWQVLIGIAGAVVIAYLYRNFKRLQIAAGRAWPSPGMVLFFAGAVILFGLVHFIGHEPLWQSILGDSYRRPAKLAIEEFVELTGYLFWLVGTIEYVYEAKSIAFQPSLPVARRRREQRRKSHKN